MTPEEMQAAHDRVIEKMWLEDAKIERSKLSIQRVANGLPLIPNRKYEKKVMP